MELKRLDVKTPILWKSHERTFAFFILNLAIMCLNYVLLFFFFVFFFFFKYNSSFCRGLYFWSEITSHHSMKSATLQLNKFQQAQNRHIVTIEHHYNTLWRDWGWKRQMSSRGIRTRDLAIHDDRRFWPRFSGILGALVKWLSSRTYAQVPLLEEVSFFMVWFDPDLPVLHIHLNNTGPTARLTARCYRARY